MDTLHYCGSYSEPNTARQMALGNVNIFTMKRVDQYDPDTRQMVHSSRWGDRAAHVSIWTSANQEERRGDKRKYCWYGASCYRLSEQHKRKYKH